MYSSADILSPNSSLVKSTIFSFIANKKFLNSSFFTLSDFCCFNPSYPERVFVGMVDLSSNHDGFLPNSGFSTISIPYNRFTNLRYSKSYFSSCVKSKWSIVFKYCGLGISPFIPRSKITGRNFSCLTLL